MGYLANAANGGDVALHKEMLGEVRDALLRDDHIGFVLEDLVAKRLDLGLLLHEPGLVEEKHRAPGRTQDGWGMMMRY